MVCVQIKNDIARIRQFLLKEILCLTLVSRIICPRLKYETRQGLFPKGDISDFLDLTTGEDL